MTGWLLDTLLYSGLLIGFVLMVRRPAGRLLGAQFAYALWALPFLRLLLPPIVLPAAFAPAAEPAQSIAAPAPVAVDWVEAAAPITMTEPVTPVTSVEAAAPAAAAFDWTLAAQVVLSAWLGIALAFLAWRVVTYRQMRRQLLAEARPVGESGRIRLVETPAVAAPIAFGVFDKVIALPPLFMAQPDRLERDLAIEHELAHHRGHDLLANFAAQALLALHWFNPLAWAGWRAMRRDQEAACDARVLAGRSRDERARYAALIAGTAAGPRALSFNGALAAPMAGPMLGEKSIIHRLRSMSMSDVTRRRRWLGRGLIAASALALPLTASFSYAVQAQEPVPPAPPAPPQAIDPSAPPEAPAAPDAPDAADARREVRTVIVRRDQDGHPVVQHFTLNPNGSDVPMPAMPHFELHGPGDPSDPEFERQMEQFGRDMEKWGEEFGQRYARQAQAQAEQWAQAARNAPEVVQSCDEDEQAKTRTADGRQRIVICNRQYRAVARSSLRNARNAIARNREISAEVRDEILSDLDEEIERIENGED